ncbi:MAG: tRNA (adenosine(37)-N6)-threonylcarbamoyltransferase complex transferase subunit TsaD [Bacteroidia bacterium]|nr:tRNA (adenosine(37)-N6)-threonylcarbamoyltransferase complex transferase subunit TsaD [Bacteroidia bacterium]
MPVILAIESSCDETSAAVCRNGEILSNIIASQLEHERYGGVIPELASRLHQQQIVRVVEAALSKAGVTQEELSAVAFTQGPGLLGALLVGVSFAKAYAMALDIPVITVNHMQAHVLANFLSPEPPECPFLCLTVSGGHTQLVYVKSLSEMEIVGHTIDDAAGEAFDKAAKLIGLPYPGGPVIDKLARSGNPAFHLFPEPEVEGLNFSFSGIKTSLLYYLQKEIQQNPDFLSQHLEDVCASYQHRIVSILIKKLEKAAKQYKVKQIAIAGGVSANSALRKRFREAGEKNRWKTFIPDFEYCTDNAGMIAIAGYFRYLDQNFADLSVTPYTREI